MAGGSQQVRRSLTDGGRRRHRRTGRNERREGALLTPHRGDVERLVPVDVARRDGRAATEQELNAADVAARGGTVQRCQLALVLRVDSGACGEEDLRRARATRRGGHVEWRTLQLSTSLQRRGRHPQEVPQELIMPEEGGHVERRRHLVVDKVHVCAPIDALSHRFHVAFGHCIHELALEAVLAAHVPAHRRSASTFAHAARASLAVAADQARRMQHTSDDARAVPIAGPFLFRVSFVDLPDRHQRLGRQDALLIEARSAW